MTRDDVLTYITTLHGHQRHDQLVALRSLFNWAKRNGMIFRNPTSRIKVGQYEYAVLQPLVPAQVDRSVAAAATPATRLILALAAVHAARVAQIADLMLDDLDLGTAGSPSPDAPAHSTTSPCSCCWTGWSTGAAGGRPPRTSTC
ncbi:hypothetical protein [Streptomyces sp. NPDC026673]|uniref:hypothetical protein n=1 Tax=Streptomyces sp. NPDC026673 TaxID=3155724 RepID=UPI0033DD5956